MTNKRTTAAALRLTLVALTLLTLLSFPGCKTLKKVGTVEIGETKEHRDFFDSMKRQAFQFRTLTAKTNAELAFGNRKVSSKVDLKMIRDSVFQLSVQPILGIELFRAEFNTGGVVIIDRMNKRYVSESYASLKGELPIEFNFYNLQAMFTNHIFIPGMKEFSPGEYERFHLSQEGSAAEIRISDRMDLQYTFRADGEEKLLSTLVTDKAGEYGLDWLYTDFRLQGGQPFPMLMNVALLQKGLALGGMDIYFSRVETDAAVTIDSTIPSKYRRVGMKELIKSISSLTK